MSEADVASTSGLGGRSTTADDVAAVLREAILTGQFPDGVELNQVKLAKHYGVSRVPLREALQRLQAEGLVIHRPHQRTVVSGLSLERVLEVIEIRIMLESYLLDRAIPLITDDTIAKLHDICSEMESISEHGPWLRLNRDFHDTIYGSSRSPVALDLAGQMSGRVERYLHMWSDGGVQRFHEANREHRRIVEAIETRDPRRARLELEVHILHTREQITALFAERSAGDTGSSSTSGETAAR